MRRFGYGNLILAALIYTALSFQLYHIHFQSFDRWEWLLPVNVSLAALGCYLLSRRWVSSFVGSVFAGAVYGFGPFMLSLARFHPTAGLLVASIPWLFCPAAFGRNTKWRFAAGVSVSVPFILVIVFFQLSTHYGLFAVSTQARLRTDDLLSLLTPLVVAEHDAIGTNIIGFYHVPIAALLMGSAMLLAARRLHILVLMGTGIALSCWRPFFAVSPVIWLAIPALCCSVLIGAGIQGIISAGPADAKWLLAGSLIQTGFAIAALMLAARYFQVFLSLADEYARLFVRTGEMYILGAIAMMILFFLARARLRMAVVRTAVLCSALAVDIYLSATFIVDRLV